MKPLHQLLLVLGASLAVTPVGAQDGAVHIGPDALPLVIDRPGLYLLTADLVAENPADGIRIDAGQVTLDLNGFGLYGAPGTTDGIHVPTNHVNIIIRNGTISGWGLSGISAVAARQVNCDLLSVSHNGFNGVHLGESSRVTNSQFVENGENGLEVENGSVVRFCTFLDNHEHGLHLHSSSVAERCLARLNGHDGFHGSHAVVIRHCLTILNSGEGIEVDTGGLVEDCTALSNGDDGIKTRGEGGTLLRCTSNNNLDDGFDLNTGSTIRHSVADGNGDEGIRTLDDGQVMRCVTRNHALGSGVKCVGTGNRVENVTAIANRRGFRADLPGNIFVGNFALENTHLDFDVASGNLAEVLSPQQGTTSSKAWINFQP